MDSLKSNHDREIIMLSERDTAAFFDAVLNPPAPSLHLRQAAERYAARLHGCGTACIATSRESERHDGDGAQYGE